MAKEIIGYIKLQIPAGKANPSPPVGPALGQRGVNIMGFCKEFNAKTSSLEVGMPIPVIITVYKDKSFSFVMKKPPASFYLKKTLNLKSGAKTPGRERVSTITQEQLQSIATEKMDDLNATTIEAAKKIIEGSARSMGIEVIS